MAQSVDLDIIDLKILAILIENANTPYTDIAKRVFVSGGTVHVRMKKMQELGVVKGAQLRIDHHKLGYDITAFLGIYLEKNSMYEEVAGKLAEVQEVVSINYTTGVYSVFVKIICKDTEHLRTVLHDKIQKIGGIQRTETFISLEEHTDRSVKLDMNQDG